MVASLKQRLDPKIEPHLLAEEGEEVIDEVHHHWVVYTYPTLISLVGAAVFVLFLFSSLQIAWVPLLLAMALFAYATYKGLSQYRDRFVITNMRVFRIWGVFSQRIATMPMARILDISVEKPFSGRLMGYGHFVFESAAQEQGLREIHFVGEPDERDLTIQRTIQRLGLRGPRPV